MMEYRVSRELLLDIAERCDRKTLLSLLQTSKDINALISDHQRSISAAKLRGFPAHPQSRLLASGGEGRRAIPEKNSLATVRELELREFRVSSILDRGGFLLTDRPETLGLTAASLDRLKAGLRRAIRLSDRLADAAADPEITRLTGGDPSLLLPAHHHHHHHHHRHRHHDSGAARYRTATRAELTRALRGRQRAVLGGLPALDLALLVTVCEAAAAGWQRYMAGSAGVDAGFHGKMEAFGELVLREGGSSALWAFVRGRGRALAHVGAAVAAVAEEAWRRGLGGADADADADADDDAGLCAAVLEELGDRLAGAGPGGGVQLPGDGPMAVRLWAHGLVGKAIGCDAWRGYYAGGFPLSP